MRFLAFTMLLAAAFDLPVPWLDRLGASALGVACLALAIGATGPRVRRASPFPLRGSRDNLADELNDTTATLANRLGAYGQREPAS